MAVQIQWRRDTAANWTSVNPVLAEGEVGYESDTDKYKVGNGSSPWGVLPYFSGTGGGGGITSEDAVDAVATALVGGANVTITYDDVVNTITVASTGEPGPTGPSGPQGFPGADGGTGDAATRLVPLIIFSGESNSGGMAPLSAATSGELAPRPEVKIFDNINLNAFADLDIGTNNNTDHAGLSPATTGWEIGLANSVANGEWFNDTLYLVQTGQGGSRVSDWNEGGTNYTKFLARVRGALNLLRSWGKIPIVYVWYSLGINDALAGTNEAGWLTDVKSLHDRMRAELGYVPICMTKFMTSSAGVNYNDSIDLYGTQDPLLFPIDATGATTTDIHHWDYAGMKLMAARMVTASKNFGQHEQYILSQIASLASGTTLAPPPALPLLVVSQATVTFVEGSAGATFSVRLDRVPLSSVVVTVAITGGNAARSPATLTFTTGNWSTNQTVTVTSPNDGTVSGNRSATTTLSSTGVVASANVAVNIIDADAGPGTPVNTVLPAISGSTTLDAVLTCTSGTWLGTPTSYAYQWKRAGTNIAGQTAATHTIVAADQGTTLTCMVTATNPSGPTAATSNGVSIPSGGGGGTATPVTWGNFASADSPSAGQIRCTSTSGSPGGLAVETIDLTQPFEVIVEYSSASDSNAVVVFIDDDSTPNYLWDGANMHVAGVFQIGSFFSTIGAGNNYMDTGVTPTTYPCKVKMAKSGNDVVYTKAEGAGAYGAVFFTRANVLAGKTTGYIKCMFVTPTVNRFITVSKA